MRLNRSSFLLIIIFLFYTPIYSQSYNQPESVVYDGDNDCYYVSNKGDGTIIKVDANDVNNKSVLNSDLSSVRGIDFIGGNVLVAAANEGVVFIDTNTGIIIQTVAIPGMGFLNDIVWTDKGTYGTAYVSDSGAGNIYGVEWVNYTVSTLATGLNNPNGLYWDSSNNRLINVPMISDAPILGVSLSDGSVTTLKETTLDNPDGIAGFFLGDYYISYWGDNSVYRFNNDFSGEPELVSSQHNGPADIFLRYLGAAGKVNKLTKTNGTSGILIVPNFDGNTVDFIEITNLSSISSISSVPEEIQLHQNFPNPFNPNTSINYELTNEELVNITIYDLLGTEVVQLTNEVQQPGIKTTKWNGLDSKGNIVNGGVYVYRLTAGNYSETKKMVLLK